jgi:hypothetical protein
MKYWRTSGYRKAARRRGIEAYYRKKAASEAIPENENVCKPKIRHSLKTILKFDHEPQMTLTVDILPWGGWSISPTAIGKKIQQAMIGYAATAA